MYEKTRSNRWQDQGRQMRKDGILNVAIAAVVLLVTVAFSFALIAEYPVGQAAAAAPNGAFASVQAMCLPA